MKAVLLGWVEQLESWQRVSGGKRKTIILYWKRLLREGAFDWTNIGALTNGRKEWRARVKVRMEWLLKWDWSKAKRWDGACDETDITERRRGWFHSS